MFTDNHTLSYNDCDCVCCQATSNRSEVVEVCRLITYSYFNDTDWNISVRCELPWWFALGFLLKSVSYWRSWCSLRRDIQPKLFQFYTETVSLWSWSSGTYLYALAPRWSLESPRSPSLKNWKILCNLETGLQYADSTYLRYTLALAVKIPGPAIINHGYANACTCRPFVWGK